MRISGSIVLYKNHPNQAWCALQSFLNARLDVEMVLIDNSPTDELRCLADEPRVRYIRAPRNLGFGAGHNLALEHVVKTSDYHLILNPDVSFRSGVLEELCEFMEANPKAGIVMPKVLYPDGRLQHLCKKLPSPGDLLLRRFSPAALQALFRSRLEHYEYLDRDYDTVMLVPHLSGCFLLVRSSALAEMGGFDPRFFMYMEDVDLCRRLGERYEAIYYPYVSIEHEYAKTSYKLRRSFFYHISSAVRYFGKWGWIHDAGRTVQNQCTDSDPDVRIPARFMIR